MTDIAVRVLAPQDWLPAAAHWPDDAAAQGAATLHRAFHERHLPLTPWLAEGLARLMQAPRPDSALPWGNGFRLCREALRTRGFGGTA